MHAHGVGTPEEGARLSVLEGAVGEEKGIVGRGSACECRALPHIAVAHYGAAVYGGVLEDEALGVDARADEGEGTSLRRVVDHRAVGKTLRPLDPDLAPHAHVEQRAGVPHHGPLPYLMGHDARGEESVGDDVGGLGEPHGAPRHQAGHLRRQPGIYHHRARAGLVEHAHLQTDATRRLRLEFHSRHIVDHGAGPHCGAPHAAGHAAHGGIVAYHAVGYQRVAELTLADHAHAHRALEAHVADAREVGAGSHKHAAPVGGRASLVLKLLCLPPFETARGARSG